MLRGQEGGRHGCGCCCVGCMEVWGSSVGREVKDCLVDCIMIRIIVFPDTCLTPHKHEALGLTWAC